MLEALKLITKRAWVAFGLLLTILGLLFVPLNVVQLPAALLAWRPVLEFLKTIWPLVGYAVALTAWLFWVDLRPAWLARQRRKFPEQHGKICHEIAAQLAGLRSLALSSDDWAGADASRAGKIDAISFRTAVKEFDRLTGQISYDTATVSAVFDYLQTCAKIVQASQKEENATDDRAKLIAIGAPVFEALHAGKPVDRKEIERIEQNGWWK